jgi:hypothetical protein
MAGSLVGDLPILVTTILFCGLGYAEACRLRRRCQVIGLMSS